MANKEQFALLKQGVEGWNKWRYENESIEPDLTGASLFQADLTQANLTRADLTRADLTRADLTGAGLFQAGLFQADLTRANLTQARLIRARLTRANLTQANLTGASLFQADLTRADLTRADLTRADLTRADLFQADLTRADLTGAGLTQANLTGAGLFQADLTRANLTQANLTQARFTRANLTRADLTEANLSWASLTQANLTGAHLMRAQLVKTNLTYANLTDCHIYGISAWNLKLEGATQTNLVITPDDEPVITVDDLEIAQFIYLLLNYKKFRNVINAVTERGVLILGRFSEGGLEVLHSVAAKLREEKYLPIIFDFDRPTDRNYTETVITLVGLARFVIVNLSGPSVPQELYATVPHFNIPFVPILEGARRPYAMFRDFFEKDWVIKPPVYFSSIEDLMEKIPGSIVAPAEEKIRERVRRLKQEDRSI